MPSNWCFYRREVHDLDAIVVASIVGGPPVNRAKTVAVAWLIHVLLSSVGFAVEEAPVPSKYVIRADSLRFTGVPSKYSVRVGE